MRTNIRRRLPELQELELTEYLAQFKSSSDRARYVIYVATVVSLLIFICNWNLSSWSWSRRRLDFAEAGIRETAHLTFARSHPPPAALPAEASRSETAENTDWAARRKQYVREQIRDSRAKKFREDALKELLFVPVPGLGVRVDVNDLGVLGGATLLFLTMLLCLAMVRQHENLYLSFFKLRRLCEQDAGAHHDGESMANFFYHALAMGQVLNYPPSLARWGRGFRNRLSGCARWFLLCLPAFVQAFVVLSNWQTVELARDAWPAGVVRIRMTLQVVLLIGITGCCLLAGAYSRACNLRWRGAFELVNPGLSVVEQRPWADWIRLPRWLRLPGVKQVKPQHRPLMTELTYSVSPPEATETQIEVEGELEIKRTGRKARINQRDLQRMARMIHAYLRWRSHTDNPAVTNYEATRNTIRGTRWLVTMKCTVARRSSR